MTGAEVGKEEHCLTTSYKEEMGSSVNVSRVAKILILISDLTSSVTYTTRMVLPSSTSW